MYSVSDIFSTTGVSSSYSSWISPTSSSTISSKVTIPEVPPNSSNTINLNSLLLKLCHQIIDFLRLGNKIRLTHYAFKLYLFAFKQKWQYIFCMYNTDNIIDVVIIYRNTRISLFCDGIDEFFWRIT